MMGKRIKMLTPIQQVILWGLFQPEDPRAFRRLQERDWRREDYARNPDKFLTLNKRWAIKNPEKKRSGILASKAKNPEYYAQQKIRYGQMRRRSDPEYRALKNLRKRVWDAVVRDTGGKKAGHTRELLGCAIPELRAHLEKKFKPGMTWENYGPVWHIDHIRPCAKFDLLDPAQQRECFHYTNLQPLFAGENFKKGAR